MISEFFAAISVKVTVRTFQNTTGSTMSWRKFECVFSVTFKARTLSFLFVESISKKLERTWVQTEDLDCPKILDRKSWTASKMSKK